MSTLLDIYRRATPGQRVRGTVWYTQYRAECARIARETGTPLRRVVATAAITSPDAQLVSNMNWTRAACESGGAAKVGRYPNAMHARYAPILAGNVSPLAGVGGHKVTAFYRAILGDPDAVVLDRWALRAVGHDRDTCTPAQYARYAAMYREAAREVNETPRDFQAIVWTVLRENGRAKLVDIHDYRRSA
jgi:hypothetical protein